MGVRFCGDDGRSAGKVNDRAGTTVVTTPSSHGRTTGGGKPALLSDLGSGRPAGLPGRAADACRSARRASSVRPSSTATGTSMLAHRRSAPSAGSAISCWSTAPTTPPEHSPPAGAAAQRLHRPGLQPGLHRRPALRLCWDRRRSHSTTRVPLSPGERAEIVATLRPGERVVLPSFPPDLGLDPVHTGLARQASTPQQSSFSAQSWSRPAGRNYRGQHGNPMTVIRATRAKHERMGRDEPQARVGLQPRAGQRFRVRSTAPACGWSAAG
jgi:hypothetical protein